MDAFERAEIVAEIARNGGALKPTYENLGVSRKGLYEKMRAAQHFHRKTPAMGRKAPIAGVWMGRALPIALLIQGSTVLA